MTGRHRRGDPADRGKGRQDSGAALYWLHFTDEYNNDNHEQAFSAAEMEVRVEQLAKRNITVTVETR